MKQKTIYDSLLPSVKSNFKASVRKYDTAKRLKYVLMSKYMWSNLTIDEMRDLFTYSNIKTWELEPYSFMYGDNILIKK